MPFTRKLLLVSLALLCSCTQLDSGRNSATPESADSSTPPSATLLSNAELETSTPSPVTTSASTTEAPDATLTPVDSTATPEATPDENWASYHNPDYGFSFRYPEDNWTVIERPDDPNLLALAYHDQGIALRIRYKRLGEAEDLLLYGGAAGDFDERGTINFLGEDVGRTVVVYEGIDRAVHYNATSVITRGDLQFTLALISNRDYERGAVVPEAVQAEADRILETFTMEGDPTGASHTFPDNAPILYYGSDGHLYRTDIEGSVKQQLTSVPDKSEEGAYIFYRPPRVSPDGRWLALNGGWGGATLLNMLERETIGVGRGVAMESPAWSPDSRHIAYLARDNRLCLASVPDLMGDCPFQGVGQLQEAVWSPDGSLIAVATIHPPEENGVCCTGEVSLLNLADGSAKVIGSYATTLEPIPGEVLSWLPDGSGLLIKNAADGGSVLFKSDTGITVSFEEPVADTSLDGQYFLTSSGTVGTIEQPALYTLPFDESGCEDDDTVLTSWSWAPDGQRLAYSMDCRKQRGASQLYVVEIETGQLLWNQSLGKNHTSVEWAPDGDYLLLEIQSSGLLRDASIQRLSSDGTGDPETIVEQAYLLGIVPQWGEP